MSVLPIILASSGEELVYVIAVLVFIGAGWIVERIKSAMSGMNQQTRTPPRPRNRPHPTSLPRPVIRPLAEDEIEERPRPTVPPAIPRPRPPVPTARAEVPARPGPPARPSAKQRPQPSRPLEERKAVIRGQAAPAVRRSEPRREPSPQPVVQEPETWARLTGGFEQIRPSESKLGQLSGLLEHTATAGHAAVEAQSLRHLSPAELRQAFVLKEILEPPLALREM